MRSEASFAVLGRLRPALVLAAVAAGAVAAAVLQATPAGAAGSCTVYWTGATSTNWTTTTNWAPSPDGTGPGRIPLSTDVACVAAAPARTTVSYTSLSRTVAGVDFSTGGISLSIDGGKLVIGSSSGAVDSVIANLAVRSGGMLAGTADVLLTGTPDLSDNAVLDGAGTTTLAATTAVTTNGMILDHGRRLLIQGQLTHSSCYDYVYVYNGAVLDNAGRLTAASNCGMRIYADSNDGSKIVNEPGATFAINQQADQTYDLGGRLDNRGRVQLSSGSLITRPISAATGSFDVPAGARMMVAPGGTLHLGASTWPNSGDLMGTGGTIDADNGLVLPALQMDGGTLTGGPTVTTLTGSNLRFTGGGTLTVATGGQATVDSLTVDGGSRVVNRGTFSHVGCAGPVALAAGSVFQNDGSYLAVTTCPSQLVGGGSPGTQLLNNGQLTVTQSRPTDVYAIDATMDNQGSVQSSKGELALNDLSNFRAGRLSAGTYAAGADPASMGNIRLTGDVTTNAAQVIVTTTGSLLDPAGDQALSTLTANSGSLTVGRTIRVEGDLANTGSVTVTKHTLYVNTYTQTAGTTTVIGALVAQTAPGVNFDGGTLTGNGRVSGYSGAAGVLPTGELGVSSTFEQRSGGILGLNLGPPASTPRVAVQGRATLAGTLALSTQAGYTPPLGATYTILTANGWAGEFETVTGQQLAGGRYLDLAYTPDGVQLTVRQLPQILLSDAAATVGNAGPTPMTFTVSLNGASSRLVTVDYATVDGTATAGSDYVARSGQLAFPAGVTELPFVVTISKDTGPEPVEQFSVALSSPSNAVLAGGGGTGTITHQEDAPTLPVVTGVSADVGLGANQVDRTISGRNFLPTSTVAITGTDLRLDRTLFVDAQTLSVTVSTTGRTTTGGNDVTVTNPGTGSTTCSACLTVTPRPQPQAAGPDLATGASSQSVTVTGTDFRPGSTGNLTGGSGVTTSAATYVSPTTLRLTVSVTSGAPLGPRDVRVTNADGGLGVCTGCFSVIGGPTLTAMTPPAVGRGTTTAVSFAGTGLAAGATLTPPSGVTFSNVRVVNSTTLSATMSVDADRARKDNLPVTVTNGAAGGFGTARCDCLTVAAMLSAADQVASVGNSGPTELVFDVQLDSGTVNPVTVDYRTVDGTATAGADYLAQSGRLTFPAFATSQQVRITILPDSGVQPDQTFSLVLSNPTGAALATPAATGTIRHDSGAVPAPTLTGLTPNTVGPGATARELTLSGRNFQPTSTVAVAGKGVTVTATTYVNATTLTVTLSTWATLTPDSRDVTVTTPDAGASTCAGCLRITAKPAATSAAPSLGTGATERIVTVTGTDFRSGADVRITGGLGVSVLSTEFVSSTALRVTLTVKETAQTGRYDVKVTNLDGGTSACVGCFTVTAGPTVLSLTPPTVLRGTTTPVTILGTGFVNGATVTGPDGVSFSNIVVVTPATITARMTVDPLRDRGTNLPITVVNPASAGYGQGSCRCLGITL